MEGIRYMRAYEIYDEENQLDIGVLLYYEKRKVYIIELRSELDEWHTEGLVYNRMGGSGGREVMTS